MKRSCLAFVVAALAVTAAHARDPINLRDVEYARPGGKPLKLDLTVPASDRPVPLVVYVHGGGWRGGSKGRSPAGVLTRAGYAVASIEYRLSGVATFPAQIHDCKAAIRFLRTRAAWYNVDPDRIGAWGSSAGGHLVALLGTTGDVAELEGEGGNPKVSSRVQAVVDFCGPADLLTIGSGLPGDRFEADARNSVALLLGGPIATRRELAKLASPVTHVSKGDAPFLIVHGERDTTVPVQQSKDLAAALRAAGVPVRLITLPDVGHNVAEGLRRDPAAALEVARFFDRHLKGAEAPAATRPVRE